jgi:hypothetical protein
VQGKLLSIIETRIGDLSIVADLCVINSKLLVISYHLGPLIFFIKLKNVWKPYKVFNAGLKATTMEINYLKKDSCLIYRNENGLSRLRLSDFKEFRLNNQFVS